MLDRLEMDFAVLATNLACHYFLFFFVVVDFVPVGGLAGTFNFNIFVLHFEESTGSTPPRKTFTFEYVKADGK